MELSDATEKFPSDTIRDRSRDLLTSSVVRMQNIPYHNYIYNRLPEDEPSGVRDVQKTSKKLKY
jgi:hypothetical protein